MDTVSKQKRSEIMSHVKSKDSKIETLFRKELWKHGLRYRKNSGKYFGKPDIILLKYKTVIFIDSCFWHGCKKHCRIPAVRKNYWTKKITRNAARDKEVSKYYKKQGWKIFRFWEHKIKKGKSMLLIVKNISGSLAQW
ncbi:MAG: very short patch repair endonuclease [Patescibacteria group bacterium]